MKGSGTSSWSGGWFGSVVSNAGNINQDEFEDILIGAPFKDVDKGAAYVIYGG